MNVKKNLGNHLKYPVDIIKLQGTVPTFLTEAEFNLKYGENTDPEHYVSLKYVYYKNFYSKTETNY